MNNFAKDIIEIGKWIVQKNMTWGTSGNVSMRGDDGKFYITASGTTIGDLLEEDIIVCDIDGKVTCGKGKPSKETGMHLEIYKRRPDINVIIHSSPFYSTLCACSDIKLENNLFIESMYYISHVSYVKYQHAGSKELVDDVAKVCTESNIILMKNHGVTVYDINVKEAKTALEVLENTCKMNVLSNIGGFTLKQVENDKVSDFLNGGYYKSRRSFDGK